MNGLQNKYNVIITGAGVSGCMAAIAAAREGASVLLLEQYGFSGGALTNAGVGPMMTFHAGTKQVVGGLAQELVDRLVEAGGSTGHIEDSTGYVSTVTPFAPETLKRVLDEMLLEAGVEVLYHSFLCAAKTEGRKLVSVTAASKNGLTEYRADCFVDATGDGDLAARAGASVKVGRNSDGLCQPMTMNFTIDNVDSKRLCREIHEHPENYNIRDLTALGRAERLLVAGFYREFAAAKAEGRVTSERNDLMLFETSEPGTYVVNATRVVRRDPLDPKELSEAERLGRKQVEEIYRMLVNEAPGCEHARLVSTGIQIGVRESRRVSGEVVLTAGDLLEGRSYPDTIALGSYPIDIHDPSGNGTESVFLERGKFYQIPLRALISRDFDNLLVCGRCISATHEAIAALRVTPISMATGQAAGAASAVVAKTGVTAREIDPKEVIRRLQKQKVILE